MTTAPATASGPCAWLISSDPVRRRSLAYAVLAAASLAAQASGHGSAQSRWETGVRAGYTFNSNPILFDRMLPDGQVSHTAVSWHVRYAFCRPDAGRTASVYQGVGLSVNSFMLPHTLGTPVGLYVFQGAPIAAVTDRLSVDYEWNFGASFGWKRTPGGDDIRSNLVVGSATNAYLNLGFKLDYALTGNLHIAAGLDLTHYSNGNTSWPNPGVNTIGAAAGIVYIPGARLARPISPFSADSDFNRGISYDIMAYGAWRKAYFPAEDGAFTELGERALLPGHFGVAGLTFAPMWDLHPTFRTGLSADIQWSENTNLTKYHVPGTYGEDLQFYRPPFYRQISAGISARAELVMPIFSLNAGIGYVLAGPAETRKLYQTVNLKTYFAGPVFLNIGYRMVEFHSPSNLMLGFGVTLGR
ncbi:MAG: acyloxyacyl hydrolase [Bacteroidales bacterium]|nr:acyloxyacyl hydrolase [Bacteroidales bacterium]